MARRPALLALLVTAGCGSSPAALPPDDFAVAAAAADLAARDAATGTDDDYVPRCGNGIKDPGEQCDNGTNAHGSGCEPDCMFTCTADAKCDDGDPCDGVERCGADHACHGGAWEPEGTACGASMICKRGVCSPVLCGDGIVTPPEECDDGNVTAGDGCEPNCRFTCVSTDPTRDCAPPDPCDGAGACNDATHTCTPGPPLPAGAWCGPMNAYCKSGVCTVPVCGNGVVEPGEQCDDGNQTAGDGCDPDCRYSCVNPATDCSQPAPACELFQCNAMHVCTAVADAAQEGAPCGPNRVCRSGACAAPNAVCGNGIVETGEQCDFGNANGPGRGCESNCTFSCTTAPDSCVVAGACTPATCKPVTVSGHVGQACIPGAPPTDGSACGAGSICLGGACRLSICGDGFVDPTRGETCEPPGTATCDASCHEIVPIVCGDGLRDGAEQCDDGNLVNLDGCDASCRFEQVQRMNWLKMQFATDATCARNAFGGAVVFGTAQTQLQGAIDTAVGDGSISIAMVALGLADLTGVSDPSFQLGVVNGSPEMPAGAPAYNGAADLDWWYAAAATGLDASRVPTAKLGAQTAAGVLSAGPGTVTLAISIGGAPTPLRFSNVIVHGAVGAPSAPLSASQVAGAYVPPGHLPSENLDPALKSYQSVGQPSANGAGTLFCIV
jgi:cysteine-rich repeat protein